jgi:hypothetical protein
MRGSPVLICNRPGGGPGAPAAGGSLAHRLAGAKRGKAEVRARPPAGLRGN